MRANHSQVEKIEPPEGLTRGSCLDGARSSGCKLWKTHVYACSFVVAFQDLCGRVLAAGIITKAHVKRSGHLSLLTLNTSTATPHVPLSVSAIHSQSIPDCRRWIWRLKRWRGDRRAHGRQGSFNLLSTTFANTTLAWQPTTAFTTPSPPRLHQQHRIPRIRWQIPGDVRGVSEGRDKGSVLRPHRSQVSNSRHLTSTLRQFVPHTSTSRSLISSIYPHCAHAGPSLRHYTIAFVRHGSSRRHRHSRSATAGRCTDTHSYIASEKQNSAHHYWQALSLESKCDRSGPVASQWQRACQRHCT